MVMLIMAWQSLALCNTYHLWGNKIRWWIQLGRGSRKPWAPFHLKINYKIFSPQRTISGISYFVRKPHKLSGFTTNPIQQSLLVKKQVTPKFDWRSYATTYRFIDREESCLDPYFELKFGMSRIFIQSSCRPNCVTHYGSSHFTHQQENET